MTEVMLFLLCVLLFLLPGMSAIYPLLDHHGKSRYEVHSSCMRALKAKLLQRLESAQMDNAKYVDQLVFFMD